MSIRQPRHAGESSASPLGNLRRAICGVLAVSTLAMQPADSMLKEVPAEKNYDYLFEGIEIVPDSAPEDEPKHAEPVIEEDPDCTPETCVPV